MAGALADALSRTMSEEDMLRQMNPVDRLKLNMPSNWATIGQEQAGQNRQQNLRDLLAIVPGPGNVIAAEDATKSFGDAADYVQQGRYGRGALASALGLLSGFGAVTGLPTGRMAGAAARGAKDVLPAFPAWHGSPHDFDEFKLDKIGTGEGAQAYGHGLYFAENPATAKSYRAALSENPFPDGDSRHGAWIMLNARGEDFTRKMLKGQVPDDQIDGIINEAKAVTSGRLYKAEIDAEPHQLLDWNKPLSEQSDEVKTALQRLPAPKGKEEYYPNFYDWVSGEVQTGRQALDELHRGIREKWLPITGRAEDALREAGIPGIRYLDQGSRGAGSNPTSNYVIFDDKLTKILSKE